MSRGEPIRSLDDPFDAPEDPARRRLFGLAGAAALGITALTAQLIRLQLYSGVEYRQQADNNRFRLQRVDPPRGVIYDRNDAPLARNRAAYAVAIVPADLPPQSEAVIRRLARMLSISPEAIQLRLEERASDPFSPAVIRSNVDPQLAYMVEERSLELPGVQVVAQPVREYIDGELTSHLLGYVGQLNAEEYEELKSDPARGYVLDDEVGKMGLEMVHESDLRGAPGEKRSEVDSAGRELRVLSIDEPRAGNNLTLTIDLRLQREITRVLAEELETFETASAIAIDPRDGQVLAMVHLPTFDNNIFSREISEAEFSALLNDPSRPLINGAIAEAHPPGSIFTIVSALGALHADVIKPETRLECGGALLFPNRLAAGGVTRFPCWATHGPQDCATALANSCNVFFFQASGGDVAGEWNGLGIERLAEWAAHLGLGEPTGISLPNEAAGFVPTPTWKRRSFQEDWFKGDTFNAAIGQGFTTMTPLQAANLAAAVANGGRLYRPQLVQKVSDERGAPLRTFEPELIRDLKLDPEKLMVVQTGLRHSFEIGRTQNETSYTGTAWEANLRHVAVAGKTGSAEWGSPGPDGQTPTHGWFTGYAPFTAPEIAISVFLRRGRGGRDAARIARKIFASYFDVPEE